MKGIGLGTPGFKGAVACSDWKIFLMCHSDVSVILKFDEISA